MTQEDKNLLLKDLCARLPYGVKIQHGNNYKPIQLWNIAILELGTYNRAYYNNGLNNESYSVIEIKPYLRPMSSMTKKEYKELKSISSYYGFAPYEYIGDWCPNYEMIDWLNAHHFDYHGLIEKGLALEAPEGMYK